MVTGIIRFVYFCKPDLLADPTFNSVGTLTWTLVESGIYLIAATLPSLRPLLRYFFKDIKFETLYKNLLGHCTRAFSRQNFSKDLTANTQFGSANGNIEAVTIGNGARSAGFVKIDK